MNTPVREPTTTIPSPIRLSRRWEWASRQAISFLMQQAVENPQVISLAAGLVDQQSLPVELTQTAVGRLFSDPERARQALQYGTTPGSDRLRRLLLEHLARLEGEDVTRFGLDIDRLVLTTGSQQLLSLAGEVLLDPGDICLVAAPTYFVFLGTLNGLGARAVPVAADEDGMRMDSLEQTLRSLEQQGELDRVKLIYVVSWYENPSGVSLSAERRGQVVEIARRWSKSGFIHVLEDAAYRELRYDGPELPSIWSFDRDRVILAQTFSKSFAPGLRVGYGVLPPALVGPVCDRKGNEDFGSAHFSQNLLAEVLASGEYVPHVERLRRVYREKRDAMLAAADRWFADLPGVSWVHPHGGLYVWMTVPESLDTGFDGPLFAHATQVEQVMYVPGDLCFSGPEDVRPRNTMRLSFGVQSPEGIDLGMKRLAAAIRFCLENQS